MDKVERQILESLQFLISLQKPSSPHYQDRMAEIMSKNHLLLYPLENMNTVDRCAKCGVEKESHFLQEYCDTSRIEMFVSVGEGVA